MCFLINLLAKVIVNQFVPSLKSQMSKFFQSFLQCLKNVTKASEHFLPKFQNLAKNVSLSSSFRRNVEGLGINALSPFL